jgi:hypothetical protein
LTRRSNATKADCELRWLIAALRCSHIANGQQRRVVIDYAVADKLRPNRCVDGNFDAFSIEQSGTTLCTQE